MSRLVDFQVFARSGCLVGDSQRIVNEALFSTYEPIRLWLNEHKQEAPFSKIVVSFGDEKSSAQWHGHVSNASGICQVTEAIDSATLLQRAGDHRWTLEVVEHALACIFRAVGWQSGQLEEFIASVAKRPLPLQHFFESLACVDESSGVKCVPWLSTRPGETKVGVRIGERDVTVVSDAAPIYLEDSLPIAKSAIREGAYVLLDRNGQTLATVTISTGALH